MLKVQLFGKGQAWYAGRPLDGFPGRQCHRLLCFLLLNRHHPHSRERLAAVFWAEYPTAASRTYLRNCLWRLREALSDAGAPADEYLLCANDSLSFPHSGPYWLDVEAFEEAIDECRDVPGDRLALEQARELARDLEKADRLYTGDLLEGTYGDWCLYDRERLRLLHLNLLCKLLACCEQAGTYEQGLENAQRILALDPTREKVHRQAMRFYWLMGNPVEALVQYQCCVQVLLEELGIQPTAKTSGLYEQMLHDRFVPSQWPVNRQNRLPGRSARDAEQVLDRLRRLEAGTEETATELREVRRLVEKTLTREGQAK